MSINWAPLQRVDGHQDLFLKYNWQIFRSLPIMIKNKGCNQPVKLGRPDWDPASILRAERKQHSAPPTTSPGSFFVQVFIGGFYIVFFIGGFTAFF